MMPPPSSVEQVEVKFVAAQDCDCKRPVTVDPETKACTACARPVCEACGEHKAAAYRGLCKKLVPVVGRDGYYLQTNEGGSVKTKVDDCDVAMCECESTSG
jgi:hypothetical protein